MKFTYLYATLFVNRQKSLAVLLKLRGDIAQNSASDSTKKSTSTKMEIEQDNCQETNDRRLTRPWWYWPVTYRDDTVPIRRQSTSTEY